MASESDADTSWSNQIIMFMELQRLQMMYALHHLVTNETGVDLTDPDNRAAAKELTLVTDGEEGPDKLESHEASPTSEADDQQHQRRKILAERVAATGLSTEATSENTAFDSTVAVTGSEIPPLKQVALAMMSAKVLILERIMNVLESDVKLLDRLTLMQREKRFRIKRQIEDQQQFLQMNDHLYTLLHTGILELRERIDTLSSISPDGTFTWVITNIREKQEEAKQGKHPSFYSHPFYVHRYGYKLCLRMYLLGDGLGKNTHLSLFLVVMKSPWDNVLRWPFQQKITLMLYDQNFKEHIIDAFRPDTSVASFQKPETNMNVASGSSLFVPLVILDPEQNQESKYIVNDTMFLKVIIDVSDLASLKWVAP